MKKPSSAQQFILDQMKQGYVLASHLDTKYRPFDMPAEHGGDLHHPNYDTRFCKRIRMATIKSMLASGFITELSRYICSRGTWDSHETETWCIHYKINTGEEQAQEAGERNG